jgi:hypothetical protein
MTNNQVQAAIFDAIGMEEVWVPAIEADGSVRDSSSVTELTSLVDLSSFPVGTRLIVRREPLHPGAQRSLYRRSTTATGASTPTRPARSTSSTS